ncbi:hypothetical protein IWX75_000009 [Arthrobacter sp. CAN_A6]|uniref:hypothetical protein n=1 Tax=Arthrobacter sp. CAN_A6 TaxID=2787721 RepID=UPI0018CA8680
MTTGPTFEEMAQLLSRVSMEVGSSEVRSRLTAAHDVIEAIPALDVVAVAFGAPAPGASESVEAAIQAHDETWIPGRRPEVARIVAGASVIGLLRREDTSMLSALACHSATYLGYQTNVQELLLLANQVLSSAAADGRSRAALPPLGTTPRRLLSGQQELSGTEAVTAVRTLARRFEEVVEYANLRLDRMDEEVNTLWWARKRHPNGSEHVWSEMPALQRVTRAAQEVTEYLRVPPATRGTVEILNELVGDVEQEPDVSLLAVSEELAASGGASARKGHHLLPFATFVHALHAYPEETGVAGSVVRQATGLASSQEVKVAGLGEQILREHSMLQVLA